MATETILTHEEQSAIYEEQTFKICSGMVVDWTGSLGDHTPVALRSAIDAFALGLVAHEGEEPTLEFLARLADRIRRRATEEKKEG